jgi:DNA primase
MIPPEIIQDIKSHAKINDVVQGLSNIRIQTTSGTKLTATCNVCNTPKKLNISIPRNIATCFKCDQSGKSSTLNPIGMLMSPHYGNKSFPDALQWLADTYNISIPKQ